MVPGLLVVALSSGPGSSSRPSGSRPGGGLVQHQHLAAPWPAHPQWPPGASARRKAQRGCAVKKQLVNAAERGRTLHAPVDLLLRQAPYSRGRKRCPYTPSPQKADTPGTGTPDLAIKRKRRMSLGSAHISSPAMYTLPGGGLVDTVEVRDERGFAAAGGTDDTHELAFFDFEADVDPEPQSRPACPGYRYRLGLPPSRLSGHAGTPPLAFSCAAPGAVLSCKQFIQRRGALFHIR